MSTLYFTRRPAIPARNITECHEAKDGRGNTYAAIKKDQGWIGAVYDSDWNLIHTVDWSDHRVQVNEMRNWLQRLADSGELVAA